MAGRKEGETAVPFDAELRKGADSLARIRDDRAEKVWAVLVQTEFNLLWINEPKLPLVRIVPPE